MSTHLWPVIETSRVNLLWFRPLQPIKEDICLAKLEEMIDIERRRFTDKGINLPFHGKAELENHPEEDGEEGDDVEEESEGGEASPEEMEAQSPNLQDS